MRFTRTDGHSWRVRWEATSREGLTLLVVRDRRPLRWWWRLRRGSRNLAAGNARDTRDGIRRVQAALRAWRQQQPDSQQGASG